MKAPDIADRYRIQSLHYLDNAARSLRAGEAAKAGEFLWGSLAEAFKAVAASKGMQLRSHRDIGDYARRLARDLGDDSIPSLYGAASHLHSNFYEAELRMEDVVPLVERIRGLVRMLLSLLPEPQVI